MLGYPSAATRPWPRINPLDAVDIKQHFSGSGRLFSRI